MLATHGAHPRALIADLYRFYRDGSLMPFKRRRQRDAWTQTPQSCKVRSA
jgi:hypothetical protein